MAVNVLHSAIDEHGVPVHEVRAGDRLRAGQGCAVEVLHPPRYGVLGSDNANSIVLAVDYQGREVLLPGDLESPGWTTCWPRSRGIATCCWPRTTAAARAIVPELAKWCTPACVVISGDGRWNLPEIDATYQAVGSRVLHTFDDGAIQVRINRPMEFSVSPFVGRDDRYRLRHPFAARPDCRR